MEGEGVLRRGMEGEGALRWGMRGSFGGAWGGGGAEGGPCVGSWGVRGVLRWDTVGRGGPSVGHGG